MNYISKRRWRQHSKTAKVFSEFSLCNRQCTSHRGDRNETIPDLQENRGYGMTQTYTQLLEVRRQTIDLP